MSKYIYAEPKWSEEDPKALAVAIIKEGAQVLDVGCGVGGFGKWLIEHKHCFVDGLEFHPDAVAAARMNLTSVQEVNLEDLHAVEAALGNKTYNVISLIDVLEHCLHPRELLETFGKHLVKDGQIVVSVPNVANHTVRLGLLCGNFDYQDSGILDRTHLHFYTRASALDLIAKAGYTVEMLDYTIPKRGFWKYVAFIDPTWSAVQFVVVGHLT